MTTPIDPTTANGRLSLYAIYEANAGKSPTRSQVAAIYAVARAVVPEGYAVVSVADVRNLVDGMFQYMGPHEDWDFLRYALPVSDDSDKENAK